MSSNKAVKCHRDMYKSRTPPWKEAYRKRCLDRLRDSREKLKCRFRNIKLPTDQDTIIEDLMREEWKSLSFERAWKNIEAKEERSGRRCLDRLRDSREKLKCRFRNIKLPTDQDTIIEDLMREEWKSLRAEQGHQDLDIENEGSLGGVNIDQVLNLFEDIQAELRQEELRMLKEFEIFEESLHFEEKSLCSAIDKLSTDEVVCPLCKRNPLLINKSVIFCSCGMRINTEQDCLTLNNVKTLLERGLQEHSQSCESEPSFSLISESGHTNLLMTCQACDWMSVVI